MSPKDWVWDWELMFITQLVPCRVNYKIFKDIGIELNIGGMVSGVSVNDFVSGEGTWTWNG